MLTKNSNGQTSEKKVNRAPDIDCPSSFFKLQMIKNIFIIRCAKKVLSAVRYLTAIQEKYIILSGEQTGNLFPLVWGRGNLHPSKYLFKASTKPNGNWEGKKKNHICFSLWERFSVSSYCLKIYMKTGILGEILSKSQCNSTQLKLIDDLCFCFFKVHVSLPSHILLNK